MNAAKNHVSNMNLKMLYHSLIQPYLAYGITLWGSAHQTNLKRLVTLQKRAVRIITNSKYNEPSNALFKSLFIPKFYDLYNIQLCKLIFAYSQGELPYPLHKMFVPNHNVHRLNTRQQNDLHVPLIRRDTVFRSFIHRGPNIWSQLPESVKSSNTNKSFNSQIKKYFLSKYT